MIVIIAAFIGQKVAIARRIETVSVLAEVLMLFGKNISIARKNPHPIYSPVFNYSQNLVLSMCPKKQVKNLRRT